MNSQKEKKIEMYIRNASNFLFGVFDHAKVYPERYKKRNPLEGTEIDGEVYGIWQGQIYGKIQDALGEDKFPWNEKKKKPYDEALEHLLKAEILGISGIIKRLILPYQAGILKEHEIEFLRWCWAKGRVPSAENAKRYTEIREESNRSIEKINMAHFYETAFVEFYLSKENKLNFVKGWSQWAFLYFGELDEEEDMRLEKYVQKK